MSVPEPVAVPPMAHDTTMIFGRVDDESIPAFGLTAEEHAAVAALPSGSALLIMQRGPATGSRYLLSTERTTAGRSEAADIFLDDVTVSRQHAEFTRHEHQFMVRDTGSLNGTYVNRSRIDQATLASGDEVQIGKFRMTFLASPHVARSE